MKLQPLNLPHEPQKLQLEFLSVVVVLNKEIHKTRIKMEIKHTNLNLELKTEEPDQL